MKRSAYRQRYHTGRPPVSGQFHGLRNTIAIAAYNQLTRRIHVRNAGSRLLAYLKQRRFFKADNRRHASGADSVGFMHPTTPLPCQIDRGIEIKHAGYSQGGILAEAVTGHKPGLRQTGIHLASSFQTGETDNQDGRLGINSLSQFFLRPFKAESGERKSQHFISLMEDSL